VWIDAWTIEKFEISLARGATRPLARMVAAAWGCCSHWIRLEQALAIPAICLKQ
jgi:hypothetical protein